MNLSQLSLDSNVVKNRKIGKSLLELAGPGVSRPIIAVQAAHFFGGIEPAARAVSTNQFVQNFSISDFLG